MENQKNEWCDYGRGLSDAFSELMNFEKTFRPTLEKKIAEYESLEERAEKLSGKLAAERAAFDQKKVAFFAGLREAETKIRADLQKEICTPPKPGKKAVNYPDDYIEQTVVAALESKAEGIAALRSKALSCLELERDLAALRVKAFTISEMPFRARQQVARNFFLALTQTAQLSVSFKYECVSFGSLAAWTEKLKNLNERLAIAAGEARAYNPLHFHAAEPNGCLEFSCYLPEADLKQVIRAWYDVKVEQGKNIDFTYESGKLRWRYSRSKDELGPRIISTSGYGSGSTDRKRA